MRGDVQRLPYPAVQLGVLGVRRAGRRRPARAEVTESNEANSVTSTPRLTSPSVSRLGDQFPRPVVAGRGAPRDRCQHRNLHLKRPYATPCRRRVAITEALSHASPIAGLALGEPAARPVPGQP